MCYAQSHSEQYNPTIQHEAKWDTFDRYAEKIHQAVVIKYIQINSLDGEKPPNLRQIPVPMDNTKVEHHRHKDCTKRNGQRNDSVLDEL